MAQWLNIVAQHPEPVPVAEGDYGYGTMPVPEMFRLRLQKVPGPVPDSTGIICEWQHMPKDQAIPRVSTEQWSIPNNTLRATPVQTILHEFALIGPLNGRVVVQLDRSGGLVAHLHYPTLPGPYQLSLL